MEAIKLIIMACAWLLCSCGWDRSPIIEPAPVRSAHATEAGGVAGSGFGDLRLAVVSGSAEVDDSGALDAGSTAMGVDTDADAPTSPDAGAQPAESADAAVAELCVASRCPTPDPLGLLWKACCMPNGECGLVISEQCK